MALIEFRGQGMVHADIGTVIAHLSDPDKLLEWVHTSVKAELIEKSYEMDSKAEDIKSLHHIQYMEYFVPFPFENRDVVFKGEIDYYYNKASNIMGAKFSSRSIQRDDVPKKDGLTRISSLFNEVDMQIVDEKKVLVTFTVVVDPAGRIPKWLVNLTTRLLPYKTISNIRDLVKKGGFDPRRKVFVEEFMKLVLSGEEFNGMKFKEK